MTPYEISNAVIGQWVGRYIWPFFRIASFVMVVPFIGTQVVPIRVRLGLSLVLTVLVVPLLGSVPQVEALSARAVDITLQQIMIGTSMAFAVLFLFQVFVLAGQITSMQMGLGFASMVDPANGLSVPVLSQFYLISITLLYLATNGHLVVFQVFLESFKTMPIGGGGLSIDSYWELAHRVVWLFSAGLLLALPAITAVLIVNISFGVMTRAAPQMNLFSLGFPLSLIFGLFSIWVLHADFAPHFMELSRKTFDYLKQMQGLP